MTSSPTGRHTESECLRNAGNGNEDDPLLALCSLSRYKVLQAPLRHQNTRRPYNAEHLDLKDCCALTSARARACQICPAAEGSPVCWSLPSWIGKTYRSKRRGNTLWAEDNWNQLRRNWESKLDEAKSFGFRKVRNWARRYRGNITALRKNRLAKEVSSMHQYYICDGKRNMPSWIWSVLHRSKSTKNRKLKSNCFVRVKFKKVVERSQVYWKVRIRIIHPLL